MRRLPAPLVAALLFFALLRSTLSAQDSRPVPPQAGKTFQSVEAQRLEADDGANPGFLWVEQGQDLWQKADGAAGRACADCHGINAEAMHGVAARYPAVDQATGKLLNIEQRINACRTGQMGAEPLAYELDGLLALTAFVTTKSRGVPRKVSIGGPAAPFFAQGRAFFSSRQGQLNLACAQCHDENAGKRLRGDVISQGQSDGWPAYRLEWQTMGSLHRRLRACSLGVRAEVLDYGAPEYVALELYLAWRGEGLPMSAPGVRR